METATETAPAVANDNAKVRNGRKPTIEVAQGNQSNPAKAPGILRKVNEVMRRVGAIGKDRRVSAPGANYNYRGIEDLYNSLQPALVDVGVVMVPEVVPGTYARELKERENKSGGVRLMTMVSFTLRLKFIDVDDASMIVAEGPAEGYDDSDKAAGKAMSYGMKTLLFAALCIPTEDPDASRPDMTSSSSEKPEDSAPKAKKDPKAAEEAIKTLREAGTPDELKAAWAKIPPTVKAEPEVSRAKDEAKDRLGL